MKRKFPFIPLLNLEMATPIVTTYRIPKARLAIQAGFSQNVGVLRASCQPPIARAKTILDDIQDGSRRNSPHKAVPMKLGRFTTP